MCASLNRIHIFKLSNVVLDLTDKSTSNDTCCRVPTLFVYLVKRTSKLVLKKRFLVFHQKEAFCKWDLIYLKSTY